MKKFALKLSIGLNLAFTLVLLLVLAHFGKASAPPFQTSTVTQSQATAPTAPTAPQVAAAPQPKPFHWNQLESGDYKNYISNLRAIGCPERALRAIVTADLDELYATRARELEHKLTDIATGPLSIRLSSFSTEQSLRNQLQGLSGEENSQIKDLLGSNSGSGPTEPEVSVAIPVEIRKHSARAKAPAQMPLVLQNVDPSALGLNSDQAQAIEDLRQSFSDQVGGPDQDPNDPGYLVRWQKAQPEIDSQLRGMLGVEVFEQYEMAVQPPDASPPTH